MNMLMFHFQFEKLESLNSLPHVVLWVIAVRNFTRSYGDSLLIKIQSTTDKLLEDMLTAAIGHPPTLLLGVYTYIAQ